MFRNFNELVGAVKAHPAKRVIAVAGAADRAVIEAALAAKRENVAEPILIGERDEILPLLESFEIDKNDVRIENASSNEDCALRAVQLVASGEATALMKGMLETRDLLRPVVRKENGLSLGKLMSHVVLFEIPGYHKLIVSTDGGMVLYPTLEEKAAIIQNAVSALRAIGCVKPAVGVLCGVEKVNPKMRETVEAAELAAMNARGEIPDCSVVGPISYDVAMDREIARHKGFDCPYCGNFDALIVPDLVSGNILGKSLIVSAKAKMAGIVVGAKAPIVLTSRGSSAEEKFLSIAFAALAAAGMK